MKNIQFILFGCLVVVIAVYIFGFRNQHPISVTNNNFVPMAEIQGPTRHATDITSTVMPESIPSIATEISEVKTPVQSLEERGDAMLFEIDALQGMPFDQSITMPFD